MECRGDNFEEQSTCLCVETCNCLKTVAVLFVLIGHYYRYAEIISVSGVFRSVGFFGAALFAFLSGYGTCISYVHKGFGNKKHWLLRKVVRIYIPFLLVSFVSEITLYRVSGGGLKKMFFSILFNTSDPIMWYIFFVLIFNVLFLLVFSMLDKNKDKFWTAFLILMTAGVIQICICSNFGIGSQWYTSTGALLLGVFYAKLDKQIKSFIGNIYRQYGIIVCAAFGLVTMVYVSKVYNNCAFLKDIAIIIAGMAFCTILYFVAIFFDKKTNAHILKSITLVGKMSLWIYLIHMKIMTILSYYFKSYLIIFLIVSFASAYFLYLMNNYFLNIKKIRKHKL